MSGASGSIVPPPTSGANLFTGKPSQASANTATFHDAEDLLNTLPGPIIRLLLILHLPISYTRSGLEIILWRNGRRVESWMVLVAWWVICLGGKHIFRYLLPPILFAPLLPLVQLRLGFTKPPPDSSATSPSSHDTVASSISDLHYIYSILPPSPLPQIQDTYSRFSQLGHLRLTRGLVITWAVWIISGSYITGYKSLLALIGTVILLLPSPPFAQLMHTVKSSLAMRRFAALLFLFVFGSPPEASYRFSQFSEWSLRNWMSAKWATSRRPSLTWTLRPRIPVTHDAINESAIADDDDVETSPPLYFRFEVHENQRWWMGLDWTSALLPQERPSWCDNHLSPVSPPPSFTLPSSSSIILPNPEGKGIIKRTAVWKWLDDDWIIVRSGPGSHSLPSPSLPNLPTIPQPAPVPDTAVGGSALGTSPTLASSPPRPSSSSSTAAEDTFSNATLRATTYAEQAFTKGLERLKARTGSPTAARRMSFEGSKRIRKDSGATVASDDMGSADDHAVPSAPMETIVERDEATDADGWVYGDNKWEGMGPKGGLGRFTRRRRWQRRAICTETVEKILDDHSGTDTIPSTNPYVIDPTPKKDKSPDLQVDPHLSSPPRKTSELSRQLSFGQDLTPPAPSIAKEVITVIPTQPAAEISTATSTTSNAQSRDDLLRQRLKKAMGSVGG